LCISDLYFLLRYACGRADIENEWTFQRCREVQASPNGHLDLWAREHYKSTILTFGLTIFDILNDPETTIGIFSHTRPIAKGFLRQIKREFEANERLKAWFPDILWQNPAKESPKWGEDDGIVVRRQGNPKESTVEAWGLVDGQPTGKHYRKRIYDDVVVPSSVTTPEMIAKTMEAWELSDNLGTEGGCFRVIGTRYHFNDTYGEMLRRKVVRPRIYPCTKDGTENFDDANCVLMSPETLAQKRRNQGPYTFHTQMLLNPKGDDTQGFRREWLTYLQAPAVPAWLNTYIVVDPANEKKKSSDFTSMWVVGLGRDKNYVVLDAVRDRLNLSERAERLFDLHERWQPLGVGYEKYGLQADIQHIEHLQTARNYRFRITELGGQTPKPDRIKRLMPLFEQARIYLPRSIHKTLYDGTTVNLIDVFVEEEYAAFPVAMHDDMLDALARIVDPAFVTKWPKAEDFGIQGQAGRSSQANVSYSKLKQRRR
jgi:phage terminase large subunit-like protein